MALSAKERKLRARLGGINAHLNGDSHEIAARARAGLLAKYEREADPEGLLTPEERARRADLLRRAHLTRASIAAAKNRRERASGGEGGPSA